MPKPKKINYEKYTKPKNQYIKQTRVTFSLPTEIVISIMDKYNVSTSGKAFKKFHLDYYFQKQREDFKG